MKKRIYFLDIARGLAVLFMFTQHTMLIHEYEAGESENLLSVVFVLLGTAPAAPVFMMLMGVFLSKSKSTLRENILRGLKLIVLGYALNLFRFTLPLSLVSLDGIDVASGESPVDLLFAVDILQLAGLSIIFIAFLNKIKNIQRFIPILILIIAIISPFLWGRFDGFILFDLLWGEGTNILFPFFPWIIYPLLGMYLSKFLLDVDNINKILSKFIWIGLGFMILGISTIEVFPVGDYLRSGLAVHILIIGFIFIWLRFCYFVENRLSEQNWIFKNLLFWSQNVTAIYVIQWIVFGWSMLVFGANEQNVYVAAILGLLVLVITHLLTKIRIIQVLFKKI